VEQAIASRGVGNLDLLLRGSETWEIEA
jgi:hypothetical protein